MKKLLTRYTRKNKLGDQVEWLELKSLLRAFIGICRDAYDETYAPEDAFDAIADECAANSWHQTIMNCLQRENYLGFDYPHQAVESILADGMFDNLTPQSKRVLMKAGQDFKASKLRP